MHVWLVIRRLQVRFLTDPAISFRKHAYSNILKILPPKTDFFQIKNIDIFHISAQNIDCEYSSEPPRRGGSNEYPQSMFLSKNKKNNVYPYKPQFYYIKVGFKGGQNFIGMFSWCSFVYSYFLRSHLCCLRRAVVSFWQKNVQKKYWLTPQKTKLAQEKCG